jgi:hypothetical protein
VWRQGCHLEAEIVIRHVKKSGTEHAPKASSSRLKLETFGPSLTASHASAGLSEVGLIGGVASGGGIVAGSVGEKPGANGTGMVTGVWCTPILVLDVGGGWTTMGMNEHDKS